MRFLIDAQLPPALAKWLVDQGHDATHVADHGMAAADDPEVWRLSVQTQAVLITKDEDFVEIRVCIDTAHRWSGFKSATQPTGS